MPVFQAVRWPLPLAVLPGLGAASCRTPRALLALLRNCWAGARLQSHSLLRVTCTLPRSRTPQGPRSRSPLARRDTQALPELHPLLRLCCQRVPGRESPEHGPLARALQPLRLSSTLAPRYTSTGLSRGSGASCRSGGMSVGIAAKVLLALPLRGGWRRVPLPESSLALEQP